MDADNLAARGGPPSRETDLCRPVTFEETWLRLRVPMLHLAALLLDRHDLAEDVVQDAFLSLHRRWETVIDPSAYLRTSVVNASRSVLRRRRLARLHVAAAADVAAAGADLEVLVAEEHQQVLSLVHRLPRRQREVLVLRYWDDLDDDAIATTLGLSASTVRATATRARRQLARLLKEQS